VCQRNSDDDSETVRVSLPPSEGDTADGLTGSANPESRAARPTSRWYAIPPVELDLSSRGKMMRDRERERETGGEREPERQRYRKDLHSLVKPDLPRSNRGECTNKTCEREYPKSNP